jgi:hypothetical protein
MGQEYNSILIIINKFTKWGYFILYLKSIILENLLRIYIKDVLIKYKVPAKIILDKDKKIILKF